MAEKSFLDRIKDEVPGFVRASNKACQTCMFATNPSKCYCQIYEKDDGEMKPNGVLFDGADCEYYEKETA